MSSLIRALSSLTPAQPPRPARQGGSVSDGEDDSNHGVESPRIASSDNPRRRTVEKRSSPLNERITDAELSGRENESLLVGEEKQFSESSSHPGLTYAGQMDLFGQTDLGHVQQDDTLTSVARPRIIGEGRRDREISMATPPALFEQLSSSSDVFVPVFHGGGTHDTPSHHPEFHREARNARLTPSTFLADVGEFVPCPRMGHYPRMTGYTPGNSDVHHERVSPPPPFLYRGHPGSHGHAESTRDMDVSTRRGRVSMDNITKRDSKRPSERPRDREYHRRFSSEVNAMPHLPAPLGGNPWPREDNTFSPPVRSVVEVEFDNFSQHAPPASLGQNRPVQQG